MADVLVCVKRVVDSTGQGDAGPGRAVDRRPVRRVHPEPARGVRDRAGGPGGQGDRRLVDRRDPGRRGRRGAAADRPRGGHRRGDAHRRRRRACAGRPTWPPELAAVGPRPRGGRPVLRAGPARQRRRRQRRLPGRHPAGPRARAGPSSTAPTPPRSRTTGSIAVGQRPRRARDVRRAAAGRRHRPGGRRRAEVPERARAG